MRLSHFLIVACAIRTPGGPGICRASPGAHAMHAGCHAEGPAGGASKRFGRVIRSGRRQGPAGDLYPVRVVLPRDHRRGRRAVRAHVGTPMTEVGPRGSRWPVWRGGRGLGTARTGRPSAAERKAHGHELWGACGPWIMNVIPERSRWVLVVRVDRPEVVPALRRTFAMSAWVDVVVDRRRSERRQDAARVAGERRAAGRRVRTATRRKRPRFGWPIEPTALRHTRRPAWCPGAARNVGRW